MRSASCPIARLTRDQAMYWFLSGFTAKLAGTEIGVKEPQPTFSPCFGGPFLPQPPAVYARLLGRKLDEHRATVWLVNTGWTGGPYGEGERMPIKATRAHGGAVGRARRRHLPHRRPLRLRGSNRRAGRRPDVAVPAFDLSDPDAYDVTAREPRDDVPRQLHPLRRGREHRRRRPPHLAAQARQHREDAAVVVRCGGEPSLPKIAAHASRPSSG